MKKVLTITWDADDSSMYTDIGENIAPFEAMAMLEYAMGEVEYMIEEEQTE